MRSKYTRQSNESFSVLWNAKDKMSMVVHKNELTEIQWIQACISAYVFCQIKSDEAYYALINRARGP